VQRAWPVILVPKLCGDFFVLRSLDDYPEKKDIPVETTRLDTIKDLPVKTTRLNTFGHPKTAPIVVKATTFESS
jgi:hypothetical protein